MGTMAEDMLGAPADEYVDREVDRCMAHDGTGVLALIGWRRIGTGRIARPERTYLLFDHITPANNSTTAGLQHELRDFAKEHGLCFSDVGGGICHQLMSEGVALPGEVIVGADSHTCTYGALGAFSTGVGATEMSAIWATGETWFRVPRTIGVQLSGTMPRGVEAKDLTLRYVSDLGMDGATYMALEFVGESAIDIPMDGRLTMCNMAVEAGAKAGMFHPDAVTREYLSAYGHDITVDPIGDVDYHRDLDIDLGDLEPLLAAPFRVDNVVTVESREGTPLDEVFVGTCTNGRYEDLARFAEVVRGKRVGVRTVVVPASRAVLLRCIETGVLRDMVEAGCTVGPPGCGPCLGAHLGVLGEGEVGLSTANRNFRNRMGVGAEYYLCSPTTAAASALTGEITVPEVSE